MLAIFTTAAGFVVRWLLGAGVAKVAVSVVLFGVLSLLVDVLLGMLPDWFAGTEMSSLFAQLPPLTGYLLDVTQFDFGFSVITSAYVTRFLIRRLPVIG